MKQASGTDESHARPISLAEIKERLHKILDAIITTASENEPSISCDPRRTREDYFLSLNSIDLLEFIISIENEFGFELADDALADSKWLLLDEWAQFIQRRVSI